MMTFASLLGERERLQAELGEKRRQERLENDLTQLESQIAYQQAKYQAERQSWLDQGRDCVSQYRQAQNEQRVLIGKIEACLNELVPQLVQARGIEVKALHDYLDNFLSGWREFGNGQARSQAAQQYYRETNIEMDSLPQFVSSYSKNIVPGTWRSKYKSANSGKFATAVDAACFAMKDEKSNQ